MATRKTATKTATKAIPSRAKAAQPKTPKTAVATKRAKPAKAQQQPVAAVTPVKAPKLVRDSFTMPKNEYAVIADLKQRAAKLARPAKKSEILLAGIAALSVMADAAFLSTLDAVPSLKTGRRPKDDAAAATREA